MNELKKLDTTKNDAIDEIDELIRIMHIKFLTGLDKEYINYDIIDNNEELDDIKTSNRDAEEKYFEEDEEEKEFENNENNINKENIKSEYT